MQNDVPRADQDDEDHDAYNQWDRNPRPQLEPQKTSLDKCNIN